MAINPLQKSRNRTKDKTGGINRPQQPKVIYMNKMILASVAMLAMLGGCASEIMKGYVGKDITEAVLDYGQPTNYLDMQNGQRAFQWTYSAMTTTPTYVTGQSNSNGLLIGNQMGSSSMFSHNGTITSSAVAFGGNSYETRCIYTLFAKKGKNDGEWIVTGFRTPKFSCE